MTLPVDKVSKSNIGVLSAKENKSNMCLSALSHSAMSHLKPHLAEVTLNQGAILWDSKRPTTDIYFPTSGLISIVLSMPDGECVEVASVAREGAVGAYFDPVQSDLLTRGVVQTGGELTRISLSNLLSAASQKHEIKDLVAATGFSPRANCLPRVTRSTRRISAFADGSINTRSAWNRKPFM